MLRQVAQNAPMISPDPRGYFITGSDTDAGKTYIGCEIIGQLHAAGLRVETRKPAESGCDDTAGDFGARDAAALREANGERESIERIAPYRFRAALAPHRAARLENRELCLRQLVEACSRDDPESCLLVEGAGGLLSPLAEDGLNADLAVALGLPLIVVVDDRVGAVNQTLMTLTAAAVRGLEVAAVVLNQVAPTGEPGMDNLADLEPYSRRPVFRCAHAARLPAMFAT